MNFFWDTYLHSYTLSRRLVPKLIKANNKQTISNINEKHRIWSKYYAKNVN